MSEYNKYEHNGVGQNENNMDQVSWQAGSSDMNVEKDQNRKSTEYSFWAEQATGNYYGGYNDNKAASDYINSVPVNNSKPKSKKASVVKFILIAACFGILAGVSFIGVQRFYDRVNPDLGNNNNYVLGSNNDDSNLKIESTKRGQIIMSSRWAVSEVIDETMPSIVSISSLSTETDYFFGENDMVGSGSGIIVGKDDDELLIATNNHVVEGADKINVIFQDETEAVAVVKGSDSAADLAVITVDISDLDKATKNSIKVAKLGDSDDVKVGEMAIAIGNALGYGQSVTVGYISALNREVEFSDNYTYKKMQLIQTDAAINPGNSGGALINIDGEVIGINSVKYSSALVEGMGYAIPITRAKPIIDELMNREILDKEEQGYLGVVVIDVTEDDSLRYNMPIGVYIREIQEGTAAEEAGLMARDIIISLNGLEITSKTQLSEKISSIIKGTKVDVTIMRNTEGTYKEQTISAVLGSRPIEDN